MLLSEPVLGCGPPLAEGLELPASLVWFLPAQKLWRESSCEFTQPTLPAGGGRMHPPNKRHFGGAPTPATGRNGGGGKRERTLNSSQLRMMQMNISSTANLVNTDFHHS